MIKVEKVVVGYLEENCYVVSLENDCLVIDSGDDVKKIINLVGNRNVVGILITHHHFDHVGALNEIKKLYKVPVIDYKNVGSKRLNNFNFEIISTPGHSADSVTYYFKDYRMMFVGDFIFKGTIGRCDLEGGDFMMMKKSIDKIKKYDKKITLYPGHGEATSLGEELKTNPYLKGDQHE